MKKTFTSQYAEILAEKQHGWICLYCGKLLIPPPRPNPFNLEHACEVDHMTPKSRGGTDDLSNLALVCKSCNAMKKDRTAEEFLEWRKEWLRNGGTQRIKENKERVRLANEKVMARLFARLAHE